MLIKSACRKTQECIDLMPATGDPGKIKDITDAVLKLVTAINKMPVVKNEEEGDGKDVDRLVGEMGVEDEKEDK
jgi:hypothetical protein